MLILCGFTKNPRGSHKKLIYRRELPKKRGGLEQFADLRGEGLGKKEGGDVFKEGLGGDTPIHTMNLAITLTVILIY